MAKTFLASDMVNDPFAVLKVQTCFGPHDLHCKDRALLPHKRRDFVANSVVQRRQFDRCSTPWALHWYRCQRSHANSDATEGLKGHKGPKGNFRVHISDFKIE